MSYDNISPHTNKCVMELFEKGKTQDEVYKILRDVVGIQEPYAKRKAAEIYEQFTKFSSLEDEIGKFVKESLIPDTKGNVPSDEDIITYGVANFGYDKVKLAAYLAEAKKPVAK
jgi:hypothetical protein